MKITIGILIGISLSIGTYSLASSDIILIKVPEYVDGYKTTEILKYVAEEMKERDDYILKQAQYEADLKSGKIKPAGLKLLYVQPSNQ